MQERGWLREFQSVRVLHVHHLKLILSKIVNTKRNTKATTNDRQPFLAFQLEHHELVPGYGAVLSGVEVSKVPGICHRRRQITQPGNFHNESVQNCTNV